MAVIAETRPPKIPENAFKTHAQSYESMNFLPDEDRFTWDKSKGMNIVLMGQAQFGADALKMAVSEGHNVTQVYGIKGKNDPLEKSVRRMAEDFYLGESHIEAPRFYDLKTEIGAGNKDAFANRVKDERGALMVMAFVEEFIPNEVLEAAGEVVEYHPSKLPEDAGSSSIPFAIAKGKTETALSLLRPGRGKVDTGPLLGIKSKDKSEGPTLLQPALVITNWDTVFTLNDVASKAGISLLRDGLRAIALGESEWVDQDLTKRTFDRKATKPTAELDHSAPAKQVYDHARAFPHLSTFVKPGTLYGADGTGVSEKWEKTVLSYERPIINLGGVVSLRDDVFLDAKPGDLVEISKDGVTVKAEDGSLTYSELQMSALKEDDKGRITEDRAARGPKMNAVDFADATGLHVRVSVRIPHK